MRKIIQSLLSLVSILLLNTFAVYAQPAPPNCPPSYSAGFNITGDSISFCLDGVSLDVQGYSTINTTSSYAVNNIPYAPYPWVGSNAILVGTDDIWGPVINLPFNFCFFGQKYSQVVIGANGQVSFDPTVANGGNAWASNGLIAPTNNAAMNNCILAPYHDVNPGVFYAGSNITWDIYGTFPCRYMVISWDSIPMFSCSNLLASQQVVLFESTYLIDINIKEKPLCAGWNGGVAHQGIQNANGTVAFMVPGRNGTQWTASNDSYRFTPNGAISGNFNYTWIDVATGATLGTGPNLSASSNPPYIPTANAQVTVVCSVITDCDTIQAFNADTVNVIVTGQVSADFDIDINLGCEDDTINFINTSTSTAGGLIGYSWDFGDGTQSFQSDPTHVYFNQTPNPPNPGVYTVRLIASDNGCLDTISKSVNLYHPINAAFQSFGPSGQQDSVCFGQPLAVDASFSVPQGGFLTYLWDWGNGVVQSSGNNSLFSYTYPQPGVYTIKLTVQDTLGCIDTVIKNIFVENTPYADFTVSDNQVCVGEPVYFADTMDQHYIGFNWNFGDGSIVPNIHNPMHTFASANNYAVTLTTNYRVCNDLTITKNINVENFPSVNLGPDTSYCPGVTNPIILTNLNATNGLYQWSTSETSSFITVTQPGYYWLKATSPSGECTTTDSIWVQRDCYINIPNSFSPNGDGSNEYFLPRELLSSGLTVFKMKIFNRWGEELYSTTALNGRGWDGRYNGVIQPMGVYVYVVDCVFQNGIIKNYTGNVTLVK